MTVSGVAHAEGAEGNAFRQSIRSALTLDPTIAKLMSLVVRWSCMRVRYRFLLLFGKPVLPIYAHSRNDTGPENWELLQDHLAAVSRRAGLNAEAFGAEIVGSIAGQLHDLGKVKPDFQAKLHGKIIDAPHSGEGARYAVGTMGHGIGKMLAYAIAGHHAGLANGVTRSRVRPTTPLCERLDRAEDVALPDWLRLSALTMPAPLATIQAGDHFATQFFTRMLFSALVDADFLETERFFNPDAARATGATSATLTTLRDTLIQSLDRFGPPKTELNRLRTAILEAAVNAAKSETGFFSLTVPTGGGKTLASLRFALDHAIAHEQRRVIYVAPFTAIIEQTADVFREFLKNDDAILEHHSSFEPEQMFDEAQTERLKLAAQNWDRPLVVTTAVQLFESLFANRTQKCRKLHNIARSVLILDEAQTLPLLLLRPCLGALQELVRGYGCSIVLCTAT